MTTFPTIPPLNPENSQELESFVLALPKVENHLHLEGAITLDAYLSVIPREFGWKPEAWLPDFRYPSFHDFEQFIFKYGEAWFRSPERYAATARELFQVKLGEQVEYLEISFAAVVCQMFDIPIRELVEAVLAEVPTNLEVRLFMGLHHDTGEGPLAPQLEEALTLPGLFGIDLHGPEDFPLRPWTLEYWPAARKAGKATKAHAGELGGPGHVREVVEKLGVQRVEHGFRAIEDPAVVDLLIQEKVTLDVCPISNFKLKTVKSLEAHPLPKLHRAGVACTVNTDDPFPFGNTLFDDYHCLIESMRMEFPELIQIARNGWEAAFLSAPRKQETLDRFDAICQHYGVVPHGS